MNTAENFIPALAKYIELVQRLNDEHDQKHYAHLMATNPTFHVVVGAEEGSRYVRVFKITGTQRSLHSFVDKTNGNILKGSWKSPVKNGVRGNIHDENISKVINHHGPNYLR